MIISGNRVATELKEEIRQTIEKKCKTRSPSLAVILVGDNPSSLTYVGAKTKACAEVGIKAIDLKLPSHTTEKQLLEHIQKCNHDPAIDGILVQVPLPSHISENLIVESLLPTKDIDGFHPVNLGKLMLGLDTGFIPCTPLGIKMLLERSSLSIKGKHVVIIGRSHIVGKPLANLLVQKKTGCDATVTIAHTQTRHLKEIAKSGDVLIAAMGSAQFVKPDMVKEGAIVVDVGNNRIADLKSKRGYRLVGDVDYELVAPKCHAITPVPGGVGPMTVACLLYNTLQSYIVD